MKYILFGGNQYYPGGGIDDLVKSSNSVEELREYFKSNDKAIGGYEGANTWGHIVDRDTLRVILRCWLRNPGVHGDEMEYEEEIPET